jgi:hypothetical protein
MSSSSSSSSSSIPVGQMSLCIPRMFPNITEARIQKTFDALNIGVVSKIDIIERVNEKGEKIKRAFVHFASWGTTPNAIKSREILLSGKPLKIVYDEPWFWMVSINKSQPKKPSVIANAPPAPPANKIRIDFDETSAAANSNAATSFMSSIEKDNSVDAVFSKKFESIAAALPVEKAIVAPALPVEKVVVKKAIVKNPSMVVRMQHMFQCEITDEIYENNIQNLRDQIDFAVNENGNQEQKHYVDTFADVPAPPKRKKAVVVVVVEETK